MKKLEELFDAEVMRKMYELCQVAEQNIKPLVDMYNAWKKEREGDLINPLCVYKWTTTNIYADLIDAWNALVFAERVLMYNDLEHWKELCEYYEWSTDNARQQLYDIMKAAGVFHGMTKFQKYQYLKED